VTITKPGVVVAQGEHVWWLLAEALQLEHMIMCQGPAVGTVPHPLPSLRRGRRAGDAPAMVRAAEQARSIADTLTAEVPEALRPPADQC
jgi:hypothetical protein